jgi:hypothetical protein
MLLGINIYGGRTKKQNTNTIINYLIGVSSSYLRGCIVRGMYIEMFAEGGGRGVLTPSSLHPLQG